MWYHISVPQVVKKLHTSNSTAKNMPYMIGITRLTQLNVSHNNKWLFTKELQLTGSISHYTGWKKTCKHINKTISKKKNAYNLADNFWSANLVENKVKRKQVINTLATSWIKVNVKHLILSVTAASCFHSLRKSRTEADLMCSAFETVFTPHTSITRL